MSQAPISRARSRAFTTTAIALVATASSTSAFAVDYLSAEQARQVLFPAAASFQDRQIQLDNTQLQAVAKLAGLPARSVSWRVQVAINKEGSALGYVIVDNVIGKFELITYALGVNMSGAIQGVEILSYRESHGGEVRMAHWRKQFVGKTVASTLRSAEDIVLISGATLSCNHITDGVRRIMAVLNVARDKLASAS
jgi:Na+-transporting NADH:ubiquinone oxidoreductase subunit NqrC